MICDSPTEKRQQKQLRFIKINGTILTFSSKKKIKNERKTMGNPFL